MSESLSDVVYCIDESYLGRCERLYVSNSMALGTINTYI